MVISVIDNKYLKFHKGLSVYLINNATPHTNHVSAGKFGDTLIE